ncbi:MAG: hypothetical protein DWH86_03245 [Planctomycetota bacterium]|nr:MAG: hypothetical protein DWH86_03245 [Planctomycetota bacterium]
MNSTLRILVLSFLASAVFVIAGCNYAIPAMWIAQGPPKKPAEYTLPKDKKLVVFVDDRKSVVSRLQLRALLADDIGTVIKQQGLVTDVVSGRELISYVRRMETSSKRLSIEELGSAVNADIVLYVEMESFTLSPDGATPKPTAQVRVKVVDVKAKERLFPPLGADPKGYPLTAEIDTLGNDAYRTSAARRNAEDALEKKLADDVTKLFYDHEPTNFGNGVSKLEG